MWLSGHREEPAAAPAEDAARIRVDAGPERVRAATPQDIEAPVEDADTWMEERLEKEAQRERMRLHARAPNKRRFWGR
jgi:hypothetical protein